MLTRGRVRPGAFALGILTGLALASCAPSGTSGASSLARAAVEPSDPIGTAEVLVVAPHPDDEAIMTAGVIAAARAAGRRVAVAVVTNGDFSCDRDGFRREGETVAAMKRLGLRDEDVFFLGYPDGHLEELGHVALEPLPRRDREGRCGAGNTTYAARGAGGTDVHSLLTGRPALYTSDALVFDLSTLIARLGPRDIYVSHPIDEHPDHAFVYAYLRRALEQRSGMRTPSAPPRIHRALVHIGGCWPTAPGLPPCADVRFAPGEDAPPLPPPLDVYTPGERLLVPTPMQAAERGDNPKFLAIAEYASQTGPLTPSLSYLFSFARAREPFFPETLAADGDTALRRAASSARGAVGNAGAWRLEGDTARLDLPQQAPLRCRIGGAGDVTTLELLRGTEGHYALRTTKTELTLERGNAAGERQLLRRWALPRAASPTPHALDLAIDLRGDDGGVAEITLRRDGELLGLAIDPHPLLSGTSITVSGASPDRLSCAPY
jgi:LmbE family N-acetylglucosaminyl deacetylase